LRIQAKLVLKHPLPSGKDYEWCIITIVTKWTVTGDLIVLCLDLPSDIRKTLTEKQLIKLPITVSLDPYWPQLLLVEQFLDKQDEAVWSIRNRVRDIEDVSKRGIAFHIGANSISHEVCRYQGALVLLMSGFMTMPGMPSTYKRHWTQQVRQ
jgi:hypothetical protein